MIDSPRGKIQLTELMDVFRSGLAALVPVVERVGIPWTEGDAYDDWDAIASTLYEQIVVNTARNAAELNSTHEFPKYDLIYPSYNGLACFEVVLASTNEFLGVFVGFEAIGRDFAKVKYVAQSADGTIDTITTLGIYFSESKIRLRIPGNLHDHVEVLTM